MKRYPSILTRALPLAAVALLCTASPVLGGEFQRSGIRGTGFNEGVAGSACGATQVSQNTNTTQVTANTIACATTGGGPTSDNHYARNFGAAVAGQNVSCVTFAVESNNTVGAWPVRVRLYTTPAAGTPVTANLTQLGPDVIVSIPPNTTNSFFTAQFPAGGVSVPPSTNLVVELFQACRSTVTSATCPPGGDGGRLFLGSNNLGQSGPTYLKSGGCAINDFQDAATIGAGFPNMHILIVLHTGVAPTNPCPADIAPAGGNGTVNIDDLFAVINAWGACPAPPAGCPADIAPPPSGNGTVNIDDLFAVINAWGPCPQPVGACCLTNGTCLRSVTQAACTSQGGNYQGNNAPCPTPSCPPPPSNDDCATPTPVTIGVPVNGSLQGATADMVPACGNPAVNSGLGRWYTVQGNGNTLTASTCGSPSQVWDARISVYCGASCASLTCIDGVNNNSCNLFHESVSWCSAPGQAYRILVHTPQPPDPGTGDYTLAVTDGASCTNPLSCGPVPSTCDEGFDAGVPAGAGNNTDGTPTSIVLPSGTWLAKNNSVPLGATGVFQGNVAVFPPQSGAGYVGMNFNATTGTNTISVWLQSPVLTLQNGQVLRFYTRAPSGTFPDRLQVRMSLNGASTNVGVGPTGIGDYTTLLLDINPTYSGQNYPDGYPFGAWQQFEVTISGVATATQGRIAFRYFVENGGPGGANSNYIGIDCVELPGN